MSNIDLSDDLKESLTENAIEQAKDSVSEYMSEFDGHHGLAKQISLDNWSDTPMEDGSISEELTNNEALQEAAKNFHWQQYKEAVDTEIENSDVPYRPMTNRQIGSYYPAGSEERALLNDLDD